MANPYLWGEPRDAAMISGTGLSMILWGQVHLRLSERYEVNVWASYDLEENAWKERPGYDQPDAER